MAKLTLNERLGRRCRALRDERKISQMDMHGFSLSHYQKIERGVLDPRLSTLSCSTAYSPSAIENSKPTSNWGEWVVRDGLNFFRFEN